MLSRRWKNEDAFFVLLFGVMAVTAALASVVQLSGIVGAFLAGLALNEAAQNKPAAEKLGFFARSLFIPSFFLVTGFLIDPIVFVRSLIDNLWLAVSIVHALDAAIVARQGRRRCACRLKYSFE